jgi:hypothetical protein
MGKQQQTILRKVNNIIKDEGFFALIIKLGSSPRSYFSKALTQIYQNNSEYILIDDSFKHVNGVCKYTYESNERVSIDTLSEKDHPEAFRRFKNKEFDIPAQYLVIVTNGKLFSHEESKEMLFPISESGDIIATSEEMRQLQQIKAIRRLIRNEGLSELYSIFQNYNTNDRDLKQYEVVAPLLGPGSTTYGHWLTEYVPRIEDILEWQDENDKQAKFLVHENSYEWQYELLELVGVAREDIMKWNGNKISTDILILPVRRGVSNSLMSDHHHPGSRIMSKKGVEWVKDQVLQKAPKIETPTNIYFSRNDISADDEFKKTRIVQNEEELVSFLGEHNYQRIFPADYSIAEQARMVNDANNLIIVDGSARANMIFASNARVIEIFGNRIHPRGPVISSLADLEYEYIVCDENEGYIDVNLETLQELMG